MDYKYYELPVCTMASGTELTLPVHELKGTEGITLGITASIHGDETITVEIIRRVFEQLKGMDIKGTVKIMPVANPLGFEMVNRNTPVDGLNLNRSFPGKYDGFTTEIMARVIVDKFLTGLDAYIDVHAGGQDPVVDYAYVMNDEAFSRSYLSKILFTPDIPYTGTSASIAAGVMNIPSVTIECGGGSNEISYVEKGVAGIMNMLRCKGLIEGEVKKREDQIYIRHIEHVDPHHGGIFVPGLTYDCMNTVVKGKVSLGKIYNPMTFELVEEIFAPYEENLMILMRCDINRIVPGDFTFMIGDLSTEVK